VKNPLEAAVLGAGPVQVPFNMGVPPSRSTMANGAESSQMVMERLNPALGGCTRLTVTLAVALAHGVIPGTV
jgi:hypothetical protein